MKLKMLIVVLVACVCGGAETEFTAEAGKQLADRGIAEVLFVKRFTLRCSHAYTEFIDAPWSPGGGLCALDTRTGKVREITPPEMNAGVVNRFDLSWDAKRIVFDFKSGPKEPYCIYEIGTDGQGLRQLTFKVSEYAEDFARYGYGPNDMHPCYLPDGGIVFTSSRCRQGVLCHSGDKFPVTTLYRMAGDGSDIRRLSFNLLSEFSPAVLPDGRILYMRWEYNRKGAGEVKCLWSIRPDGSGSAEVYGNTIMDPETMLYGRPVPGTDKISFLGCSHWGPNNAVGTIILLDTKADPTSTNAMRIVTPDVQALTHGGFSFIIDGKRVDDRTGALGRLFKDPYPLAENLFLAACKPKGLNWDTKTGYALVLVDDNGTATPLLKDASIGLWHPYPLLTRPVPPIPGEIRNDDLAVRKLAQCLVSDVYKGLDGIKPGEVKTLRVLEQVARPWAARRHWAGDEQGMAHSALAPKILGLHVSLGTVPVEADGSANFLVPADRNIYFQVLDAEGRALQTERTYVNYAVGEVRGCVGCHDRGQIGGKSSVQSAMKRVPSIIRQEEGVNGTVDYLRQIQPIFDAACVRCHGEKEPAGGLTLTSKPTKLYTAGYEALAQRNLVGLQANENSVRTPDIFYTPPKHYGACSSVLGGMFSSSKPLNDRVTALREKHKAVKLTDTQKRILFRWLDICCQFYPSYWGKKNEQYAADPFFRPEVTLEEALAPMPPDGMRALYGFQERPNFRPTTGVRKPWLNGRYAPVDSGAYFEGDYDQVLARAKKERKCILISVGRDICPLSTQFYHYIKQGLVVIDPDKVIWVKFDADNRNHVEIYEQYGCDYAPTLPLTCLLSPDAEVIAFRGGFGTSEEYVNLLKKAASIR